MQPRRQQPRTLEETTATKPIAHFRGAGDSGEVSLSRYFPEGTEYFYGYPAGEDSQFFNRVPPLSEELVTARSLICAGEHVQPIVLSAAVDPSIIDFLENAVGFSYGDRSNVIVLPPHITHDVVGGDRNALMKLALSRLTKPGSLVMAQPYLDPLIVDRYQLSPALTIWLNDKKHLPEYVPQSCLPERYAQFPHGRAFAASKDRFPLPCVVKVSSSSSGDGVRICRTAPQLERAREEYAAIGGSILVEQFVRVVRNYGIQFGIPHDREKPVEIIGVSEQLTTAEGEFVGGIIDPSRLSPEIGGINRLLVERILPAVREMGWYGVGGFDVLLDRSGRCYVADPNFRMTGVTSYLCEARNGRIRRCMVSFIATFAGTESDFRQSIVPLAREGDPRQLIHIIALTRHGDTFRLNAAMYFEPDEGESIVQSAQRLIGLGMKSKALKRLGESGRRKYPDFFSC
jgi:hypothetical protein